MRHPQAFVILMIALSVAFGALIWAGSLWGALGALVSGLALAFVISMAWLWSPRSGIGRQRRPTHDSFSGLR
jgi:hypothetical protein